MRKTFIAAIAAATLLIAAGCSSSPGGTKHNDADVAFAQMMIPHHQQAVEMSKLARTRAQNQDVKELAGAIEAAQDPEIQTMRGWLKSWGEDDLSGRMGHDMPGMMSASTMGGLRDASGVSFDRAFLRSMIAHHEGAIVMAKTEKKNGEFPAALSLADAIIATQTAEIKRMREMLR
jgi:uncharacterized protein (DUF305 family)